jgi:hypothetical protein
MSAQNGQRARFQINRKRRVVRLMQMRALRLALKEPKTTTPADAEPAADAAPAARSRGGPALLAGN